jgi:ferredoxin
VIELRRTLLDLLISRYLDLSEIKRVAKKWKVKKSSFSLKKSGPPELIRTGVCIKCTTCTYYCPTGGISLKKIHQRYMNHQVSELKPECQICEDLKLEKDTL